MSRRITSDLINITNGLHHLNGYFSGKKYVYPYGCSRRVIPSSAAPHRYECKYVKQDFYECHTTSLIKHTILARMTNGISSNYVASETKTFTVKWFDTVHFGYPAPARPIQGYYDSPKPQCPPLDPKPCDPSEKKSPGSNPSNCPVQPMARIITCKPTKRDTCRPPTRKNPCDPKEKKKSPCGLKLSTCSITTKTKFDISYATNVLLVSQKQFIENDPSLDLLENDPLKYAKQDVLIQDLDEKSHHLKTCLPRGDNRRSSSCPPSLEIPNRRCTDLHVIYDFLSPIRCASMGYIEGDLFSTVTCAAKNEPRKGGPCSRLPKKTSKDGLKGAEKKDKENKRNPCARLRKRRGKGKGKGKGSVCSHHHMVAGPSSENSGKSIIGLANPLPIQDEDQSPSGSGSLRGIPNNFSTLLFPKGTAASAVCPVPKCDDYLPSGKEYKVKESIPSQNEVAVFRCSGRAGKRSKQPICPIKWTPKRKGDTCRPAGKKSACGPPKRYVDCSRDDKECTGPACPPLKKVYSCPPPTRGKRPRPTNR